MIVSPPNSYVHMNSYEIQSPTGYCLEVGGLVIRWWGWGPHEWDQCAFKKRPET